MKNQEQKEYEAPQTTCLEVELEQGFMKASIFDPNDGKDQGVSIEQHEVNPIEEDYFKDGTGTWN